MNISGIQEVLIFFTVLSLIVYFRADRIKKNCIGLVPKSDMEKMIIWWLDHQLWYSVVFGVMGVVLEFVK